MMVTHKIELRTTATQGEYLRRCCGTMRFVYNQLVAKFRAGEKYNRKEWQKFCVNLRQSTTWMNRVSSRAVYEAADNFNDALSRFFRTRNQVDGKKWNPPTFKKKREQQACRFSCAAQFSVNGRSLRIQGLKEQIQMRERIRFNGMRKSVSIKFHAGKWYAYFLVETQNQPKFDLTQKPSVGIDFGLKSLAVLSNGEVIENPKPLKKSLKLLKRRQRQASRKFVKGRKQQSRRYKIAMARVSRVYKKVADRRSAAQHKFTRNVVARFSRITIEDLHVSGMRNNRRLSRSISDAAWSSLRQKLQYKCERAGIELVVADRFFASSKTCSECGHKVDVLFIYQRTFECPRCSLSLDRDLNAAINLDRYKPTTRPIRASRKTRDVGMHKTSSEAVLLDVANINLALSIEEGSLLKS